MKNLKQIPDKLKFYCDQPLRVGFSGGSDSTALLLLLLQWGWTPEKLECVHFEHGLRGEASRRDAIWCRDFCEKLNIKFTLVELELNAQESSGSIEDRARRARLNWYELNDNNMPIALAHHADDAAETLLLKLSRGGNVSALSSLRFERKIGNLTLLRPLLDWHKSELEDFLRGQQINSWRLDASNESNEFHRNYLRNELLKNWSLYHPPVRSGLQSSLQTLALDADFIESLAAEKLAALGKELKRETPVAFWQNLHPALLARVLPGYLRGFTGQNAFDISRNMLENFQKALNLPPSAEKRLIPLGCDCTFELKNDRLKLLAAVEKSAPLPEKVWHWQTDPVIEFGNWQLTAEVSEDAFSSGKDAVFCFDVAAVPDSFVLHPRRGGEKMQLFGENSLRRVKHILSAYPDKEEVFLLCAPDRTIYLLGNWRRSAHAVVTAGSTKILKISIKKLQ